MPKVYKFPRHKIKRCLELADMVYELGSKCSSKACAQKLGVSLSGGFNTWVSSCVKFGLITHKKGSLETTTLYTKIKFSESDKNRIKYLTESFLNIDLYKNVKLYCESVNSFTKESIISYLADLGTIRASMIQTVSEQIYSDFLDLDVVTINFGGNEKDIEHVQWMPFPSHKNREGVDSYRPQAESTANKQENESINLQNMSSLDVKDISPLDVQHMSPFKVEKKAPIKGVDSYLGHIEDKGAEGRHSTESGEYLKEKDEYLKEKGEYSTEASEYSREEGAGQIYKRASAQNEAASDASLMPKVSLNIPQEGISLDMTIMSKKDIQAIRAMLDVIERRID